MSSGLAVRTVARKDNFSSASLMSPSIPSQPSPSSPVPYDRKDLTLAAAGARKKVGGVSFAGDSKDKDDAKTAAEKKALAVKEKRTRLARLKTMRLDRMGSDAMLIKGGKAERPAVEYSLWSCDPHRVIKEDGRPFTHNFRCLSQHQQSRIKVLICITAYAESWDEIRGTIAGVVNNLCTLQRWHDEQAQGKRSWGDSQQLRQSCINLKPSEVAVMVVFDGRLKASKTIFEGETAVLTAAHREGMEKAVQPFLDNPRPSHSDVREAHIFEMDYVAERSRGELANVPLNLIFCIKEKNGGKLNSHVWFFRCFSPLLRPRYCVLLDAGTVPDPTAILHLYADMEENCHIGGCAGEICVDPTQQNVFDLVVSAQHFEYTAANLLDKSFESVMGFISVLPGAFSAYRYEAIAGTPLNVYFRLEDQDAATLSPGQANAYLAEDRLLGFEIVAKRGCKYVLHYNHKSRAFTDVPATIGMLVRQRRRWMNGSLFAQLMALGAWARLISQTRHNVFRKAGFCLLFFYHVLSLLLSFLLLGNAYFGYALLFRVLSSQLIGVTGSSDAAAVVNTAFTVMMWIFLLILLTLFIYSLGNRPEESETIWSVAVHILGGFNTVSSALLFWMIRDWTTNWQIWTGGIAAFGAIMFCAMFQRRFANIISTLAQYIWQIPMYLFVLPIYSLCNTNDVSWGTREAHTTAHQAEIKAKMDRNFREFRSRIVILYVLINLLFSQALDSFSKPTAQAQAAGATVNTNALTIYVISLACVSAFMLGLRVVGCLIYVALEWIKYANVCARNGNKCCRKHAPPYSRAGRPTMFDGAGAVGGLMMKKPNSLDAAAGMEKVVVGPNAASAATTLYTNGLYAGSMSSFPSFPSMGSMVGGGMGNSMSHTNTMTMSRSAAALSAIKESGTEVDEDDDEGGSKRKVMSSPGFGGARTMLSGRGASNDTTTTATVASSVYSVYRSPKSVLRTGNSSSMLLTRSNSKSGIKAPSGRGLTLEVGGAAAAGSGSIADAATGLSAMTPQQGLRTGSNKSDFGANAAGGGYSSRSLGGGGGGGYSSRSLGANGAGGAGDPSDYYDYYANMPEGHYLASDGNFYPVPEGHYLASDGNVYPLTDYEGDEEDDDGGGSGSDVEGLESPAGGGDADTTAESTSITLLNDVGSGEPMGIKGIKEEDEDEDEDDKGDDVNSVAEAEANKERRPSVTRLDSLLRAQTFVATAASSALSRPSGKFIPPGGDSGTATPTNAAKRPSHFTSTTTTTTGSVPAAAGEGQVPAAAPAATAAPEEAAADE